MERGSLRLVLCLSVAFFMMLCLYRAHQPQWIGMTHGPRSSQRSVALTFDDGPNPPYTEEILKLLSRFNAKATFFVTGKNIDLHPNSAAAIVKAGHQLGNHSFSHHSFLTLSPKDLESEVQITDDRIRRSGFLGRIPIRAPFDTLSPLTWIWLQSRGRELVSFDVQPTPPDYYRSDPHKMADSIVSGTKPGSIILLHDGEGIRIETLFATKLILERLSAKNYRFVTLEGLTQMHQNI